MQEKGVVARINVSDANYKKFRQLLLKEGVTVKDKIGDYVTSYVKRRSPHGGESKARSGTSKKNPSA